MRKGLERFKNGSAVERLLYAVFALVGRVLPATRRDRIVTGIKRAIGYCPAYARRVKGLGVTTDKRSPQVIVSLTSYPARIKTVHRVVTALLNQTFKPDKVILWLGEDKFPRREAELPKKLLRLREHGLTIGWCKDLRSYTKLVPSLREFPDDIIATADDDTLYGPDWLARLWTSYMSAPDCVHSCRVLSMPKETDGCIPPYTSWSFVNADSPARCSNFLLGYGGVLYPPRALDREVLNVEMFQKLAPMADDIWFWAMAVKKGTKICVVRNPVLPQCDIFATQATALANVNVDGEGLNDWQLKSVVSQYNLSWMIWKE